MRPKRRPKKIPATWYGTFGREFAKFIQISYEMRTKFVRIRQIRTKFVRMVRALLRMSRALPANFTRISRFVRISKNSKFQQKSTQIHVKFTHA